MKKLFAILIILSSISCKKEKQQFNLDEITETDTSGNIIGNINPSNWTIHSFSDADDFDKSVFNFYETRYQRLSDPNFSFSHFKTSCPAPSTFNLVVYPNPMKTDCWLHFNLSTNLVFQNSIEIIVKKNGEEIQTSGFYNYTTWKSRINALVVRDFIYYGIFITADSCIYYTKGNVIGCTN